MLPLEGRIDATSSSLRSFSTAIRGHLDEIPARGDGARHCRPSSARPSISRRRCARSGTRSRRSSRRSGIGRARRPSTTASQSEGSKNPWQAQVTIPSRASQSEWRGEEVHLGYFPQRRRRLAPSSRSSRTTIGSTMSTSARTEQHELQGGPRRWTKDDEGGPEVGRSAALKEAPAPAPAAPAGRPRPAAARNRRRGSGDGPRAPGPARADETERLAARDPPRVLAPVPTTTPAPPVSAGTPAELAGAVLARLGVETVRPSANCAVAQLLLRVAEATRSDGRLRKKSGRS